VLSQERHRTIVATAGKPPRQDHSPSQLISTKKLPARKGRQSPALTPHEKVVHRPKLNRRPDVLNYPASSAFSGSTYKIHAVDEMEKYKSNSRINVG
jgi:hypothetical protein